MMKPSTISTTTTTTTTIKILFMSFFFNYNVLLVFLPNFSQLHLRLLGIDP